MAFHSSFFNSAFVHIFFNEGNCKTSGDKDLASSDYKILTESLNGSAKNPETLMF